MVMLYNGNCLDIMQRIQENSVDLILTDPPYNIGNFMKNRKAQLHTMRENVFYDKGWDNQEVDEWKSLIDGFFKNAIRVLKTGAGLIVFASVLKVQDIKDIAESNGFYYKTTGIWHKTNPMPRNMNLQFINSTEPWLYFIHGKRTGTFNNEGKAIHDFVETSVTPLSERKFGKHPTAKPEKLMSYFVEMLSNEGDTVLDPFMGSGTTGVACVNCDRNFIGIELESKYYEIAHMRINEAMNAPRQMEI